MQSHEAYLKRAIELSVKSRESGNTPFAALLVDKNGNIIMEQMNNEITEHKCTGHAETQLVEIFRDYLENMEESCFYSKEESVAMIRQIIDYLKKKRTETE